jgi:hypothetical protein
MTLTLPAWLTVAEVNFFVAGLFGIIGHFISKRAKGEISGNLWDYLVRDKPGSTLASLLALVACTFAAEAIGGLDALRLSGVVGAGFCAGWTGDSAFNRGSM